MLRTPSLALCLLAACSGGARSPPRPAVVARPASPPAPPAAEPEPVPASCLPAAARAAPLAAITARAARATVCFGEGKPPRVHENPAVAVGEVLMQDAASRGRPVPPEPSCVTLDATGAITGARAWRDVLAEPALGPPRFRARATPAGFEVCERGAACKQIPVAFPPPGMRKAIPIDVTVNDDGTRLFAILPEQIGKGPSDLVMWGDLHDVASGARLHRVRLSGVLGADRPVFEDPIHLDQYAYFVGSRVVVGDFAGGFGPPRGAAMLLDPARGTARFLHDHEGGAMPVGDRLLVVQGRAAALVALDAARPLAFLEVPGGGGFAAAQVGDKIVLAYGEPAGVAIIDPAAGTAGAPRPLAICP